MRRGANLGDVVTTSRRYRFRQNFHIRDCALLGSGQLSSGGNR
jgi:hypothetical protein